MKHPLSYSEDTGLYILMSLRRPRRCHGISDYIEQATGGKVKPGAGTVYNAVSQMRRRNIITVYDNRDCGTVYELTDLGRSILHREAERISRLHSFMGQLYGIGELKKCQ